MQAKKLLLKPWKKSELGFSPWHWHENTCWNRRIFLEDSMRFYAHAPRRFQKILDVQSTRVIFQLFPKVLLEVQVYCVCIPHYFCSMFHLFLHLTYSASDLSCVSSVPRLICSASHSAPHLFHVPDIPCLKI